MNLPELTKEIISCITIASSAIPQIVGAEVVKESTKKVYNWLFDKLKIQNKSEVLDEFKLKPKDNNISTKLSLEIEAILINTENFNEALNLLNSVQIKSQKAILNQENIESTNSINFSELVTKFEEIEVNQKNENSDNIINF